MARPKKQHLSEDEKAERKKHAQEQATVSTILKRPADSAVRQEKFSKLEVLTEKAREASSEKSDFVKAMNRVYGYHAKAIPLITALRKLDKNPVVRSHILLDLQQAMKDHGWDDELRMLETLVGQGGDDGSLFDETSVGEAQAAERADDPGRARKRNSRVAPVAVPEEGIPLDEAEKRFTESAQAKEDSVDRVRKSLRAEKAAKKAPTAEEPAVEDEDDPRPRFLKKKAADERGDMNERGFRIVS